MEQYVKIIVSFIGMIVAAVSFLIMTRVRPSEAQKWTTNAVIALLIYHAANCIKPWFASERLYLYMSLAIYISTVSAGLFFGLAMLEFCEIKISLKLRNIFIGTATGIVIFFCFVCRGESWFGEEITFIPNTEIPGMYENEWTAGPMYYVGNTILDCVIVAFIVYILINGFRKKGKKSESLKKTLLILLIPVVVTLLSFTGLIPTAMTNHISIIAINIALIAAVIRYDITTTVSDAKEQAIETVDDGVIIMDNLRHFQYANAKAIKIFPELNSENEDTVTDFIKREFVSGLVHKDNRTYEIRKDTEKNEYGKKLGNLILIHDITEQEERIREQEKTYRAEETLDQSIKAMAQAIDIKDPYTRGHSNRVAEYSKMIAERLHLPTEQIKDIYRMGLLHDIGKIGIDDAIIRKDTGLTESEYETIKSHSEMGDIILKNITALPELHLVARWHHERFDGKGYPDHLTDSEIPLYTKIISVADCYDAMASCRSYRDYLPQNVVRDEIEKGMGTQFDPMIAKIMIEIIDEDKNYSLHQQTVS